MRLTRNDADTRRTVPVGEPIEIELPETPTTGYRWRLDTADNFEQVNDQHTATVLTAGAPGLRVRTIRPRRTDVHHFAPYLGQCEQRQSPRLGQTPHI
ncbi:MAG: protease inhibitor I42 family protein [Pseudonocardiaceae bacterium]